MATALNRRPLGTRQHLQQLANSPQKSRTPSASAKRPRSPDLLADSLASQINPKRVRSTTADPPVPSPVPEEERRDKEQRRQAREAVKNEFRIKYTRAFPTWVFYFDLDQLDPDASALRSSLASRVVHLGARVEDFFSNEITHLITNQPILAEENISNKENARRLRNAVSRALSLKSPIKLKGRTVEDADSQNFNLVEKAQAFNMKIWNTTKLDSILERCDVPVSLTTSNKHLQGVQHTPTTTATQRNLTRLLASERLHGTTERDPTQKRHDFRYFSKCSYFVLVEDMRQELATIHALEYPVHRARDGKERGAWPVLYCHPKSRGPFIEFDERERRRWEKSRRTEEENKETERQQRVAKELRRKRQAQAQLLARKAGDLRRSVSMNNLHRQVSNTGREDLVDLDADFPDTQTSVHASGYLPSTSAYIAASGNSVGITSTTGTTSTAGGSLRALELPANLRGRIQQQVVTSRKVSSLVTGKDVSSRKPGVMGPPLDIPERPGTLLRKSRSTNTLRLPKRDEGSKPGYCESCRVRFEDFESHIRDRRHRKFAVDDSNYLQLDFVLNRVKRRTQQQYREQGGHYSAGDDHHPSSVDYPMCSSPPPSPRDEDSTWFKEMDVGENNDRDA